MKLLVGVGTLAVTLGIMMMLGMFPTPAYANIFLIDDFSDDNDDDGTMGMCDFTRSVAGQATGIQTGQNGVIDMIRECTLKIQQVPLSSGPEAMITVDEVFATGRFLQESTGFAIIRIKFRH